MLRFFALILFLSQIVFLSADLIITRTESGLLSKEYYGKNLMMTEESDRRTIYDINKQTLSVIYDDRQSYFSTSLTEYKNALKELMNEMIEAQISQFEAMSGKIRDEVIEMLFFSEEAMPSTSITHKKIGNEKISEIECDKYAVYDGDKKISELFVSPKVHSLIKAEVDINKAQSMVDDLANVMNEVMEEIAGKALPENNEDNVIQELSKDAYLVWERYVDEMSMYNSTIEIKYTTEKVPASKYEIPANYGKLEIKEALMLDMAASSMDSNE